MNKTLVGVTLLAIGSFASNASASTVVNYGDGSNSLDTSTGLLWLDLNLSINRSYLDVSANFDVGGDFAGYRYATAYEVMQLWQHAGVTGPGVGTPQPCTPSPGNSLCFAETTPVAATATLVALLGGDTWTPDFSKGGVIGLSSTPMALVYDGSGNPIQAYYTPQIDLYFDPANASTYALASALVVQGLRDYISEDIYGSWLVSTTRLEVVPIPAALPLLASCLGALGFIGWRRKRKAAAVAA